MSEVIEKKKKKKKYQQFFSGRKTTPIRSKYISNAKPDAKRRSYMFPTTKR